MPVTNLFQALLESSTDHIYVIDRELRYTHVSRGGASVLGLTPEQMVGRTWREIGLPSSTMEPVEAEWKHIFATGETQQRDTSFGGRHFESVAFPVRVDGAIAAVMVMSRDVTPRVNAQNELRQSRERYRSLVSNSSEGIWRFELDTPIDASLPEDEQIDLAFARGFLAECNDAMARMYGYERAEEIIGTRLPEMLDPTQESNREFLRAFIRGGYRLTNAESAELDRYGQRRYFLNSFIGTIENGRLFRAWGTQRDVTDEKATIDRIRISEQRLQALVSATEEVVWIGDPDGQLKSISPTWTSLTGQSAAGAAGTGWLAMIHPAERESTMAQWKRVVEGRTALEIVVRIKTTAGYRHYRARSVPVLDDEGTVCEWVGAFADVDAEHHHEELVVAERTRAEFIATANDLFVQTLDYEQTLRNLVDMAVPRLGDWCAVDMIDSDGSIRRLAVKHPDPEILRLAFELQDRFPGDTSSARGLHAVIRTGRTDWMREIPDSLIEGSAVSPEHLEMMRKLRLKSYICTPIKVRGRVAGVLTLVSSGESRLYSEADVRLTEELALRAGYAIENATAYSEALTASRSKDEFLATMSHELRTPLTAILGWANLVRLANYDGETMRKAIDMIERSAKTQAALIDDLLDVSRIITGKFHLEPMDVDLVRVVHNVIEASRPAAEGKRIGIEVSAPSSLMIHADPNRMQQIVWNLISNAVKFSNEHGRVNVELLRQGDAAVIRIRDEGTGIDPELLPRVFDRFWQADSSSNRVQGGLGLGLAIVKHLTELHGGTVSAQSAGQGRGAIFTVTLPVGERASRPQSAGVSPADQTV